MVAGFSQTWAMVFINNSFSKWEKQGYTILHDIFIDVWNNLQMRLLSHYDICIQKKFVSWVLHLKNIWNAMAIASL